jgi:subtilase family serine protease
MLASLGLSFVAVGCMQPEADDSADDADFAGVEQVPTSPVCTGALHCNAHVVTESGQIKADATPQGFAPATLRAAYHVKTSTVTTTVAVVDAYNYPNAESDLAKYRSQFGLPPCTKANGCFKVVNENGAASPLPGPAPAGDDWTVEAALDLDMASAACPTCKLILVEAQDDVGNGLYLANDGAAVAHATVVSNSWGGGEGGTEATFEKHFTHTGVGYFASTGDNGFDNELSFGAAQYPATSAHVTAVGGTTLVKATNTRGFSEKAWVDGGANCSTVIARPSFEPAISACSKRYNSDVAADADPNTGVAVFNAANGGFIVVGGTSASSPFVAGVMAVYGLGTDGPSFSYSHRTDFFDVTHGRDGTCGDILCNAAVGWDGPTGNGTPNGTKL